MAIPFCVVIIRSIVSWTDPNWRRWLRICIAMQVYNIKCLTCNNTYVGQTGRFESKILWAYTVHRKQQSAICIRYAWLHVILFNFSHDLSKLSSSCFSSNTFQNCQGISDLFFSEVTKFQYLTRLCCKCSISHLSPTCWSFCWICFLHRNLHSHINTLIYVQFAIFLLLHESTQM